MDAIQDWLVDPDTNDIITDVIHLPEMSLQMLPDLRSQTCGAVEDTVAEKIGLYIGSERSSGAKQGRLLTLRKS